MMPRKIRIRSRLWFLVPCLLREVKSPKKAGTPKLQRKGNLWTWHLDSCPPDSSNTKPIIRDDLHLAQSGLKCVPLYMLQFELVHSGS